MGIFSNNNNKGKLVLVFDIGSSSVGGALFLMQESGVPKIIMSLREPIAMQKTFDVGKFLSSTIKSLDVVVGKIYKMGVGMPDKVFCVLSSPWYTSQTRVIRLEKNTPFIFTPKLALDLIKKEINLFEDEYLAKYSDVENKVRSIEFKNIKVMLNGYEASNPLDQKTKELEMTIFVSISPEQVLNKIEETIRRHFYTEEVKFSSFILASFAVVRDMYSHSENFLLIDIDGEMTNISMVKKNVLRESISFPLGLNFMIRGAASLLHCSLHEAQSLISLFEDGHATESIAEEIGPVLDRLKKEWLAKFQESLSSISNDISVPLDIYLSVDREMADFFSKAIKSEQFNQYILTESKFEVTVLNTEIFHNMVFFEENAIRDPFLMIDSIYISRFFN